MAAAWLRACVYFLVLISYRIKFLIPLPSSILLFEPVHEISNNVVCSTSKASYQPAHMRSLIRAFATKIVKLLTEHHLKFLSLKGGCTGSSESTHVKMPHCWKSHALAHFLLLSCYCVVPQIATVGKAWVYRRYAHMIIQYIF